jgi:hypothetical protein
LNLVESSLLRCGHNKICALIVAVFVVKNRLYCEQVVGSS